MRGVVQRVALRASDADLLLLLVIVDARLAPLAAAIALLHPL